MPKRILIVDDDRFLLDMYSIKFAERGFEVTVADDGLAALTKLESGLQPDIFLVDILMPKLDGFALIRQLKDKHLVENAAVIILSNLGQEEDIKKGLDLGVSGYIVKALATPSEVVNKAVDISDHKKSN